MRVAAVVLDPNTQSPVLVLRGIDEPERYLPIFIGGLEATSIATVLAGVEMPRPMTHDLMITALGELGWQIRRITVSKLEAGTFFGELTIAHRSGAENVLDARPSDCIALALRTEASIFVMESVLAEAGGVAEEGTDLPGEDVPETAEPPAEGAEEDEDNAQPLPDKNVRLEDLDPEKFGKYKM